MRKRLILNLTRMQLVAAFLTGLFAGIGIEQMFKGCP